jgi:hypothetical protein
MLDKSRESRSRRPPGQGVALSLVAWLNAGQRTEEVLGLLESAQRIQSRVDASGNRLIHKVQLSRDKNLQSLNDSLLSFTFRPQLSVEAHKTFTVSWVPSEASRRRGKLYADPGESNNAMRVIRLLEQGLIQIIRRCTCEKWFVAKMAKQTFCSMSCRQAAYRSTEGYRAKRREYMRDYYRKWQSPKRFRSKGQLAKRKGR